MTVIGNKLSFKKCSSLDDTYTLGQSELMHSTNIDELD